MKSLSRVVWSEGMYLGPHHFQTQSRYFEDSARFAIENSWFEPWGLISCNLDEEAIRNGRVAVLSAQGMFEDGLAFEMATGDLAMGRGDPVPESRDIRNIFPPDSESLGVSLAISPRRQGAANCDLDGAGRDARYRAVPRTVPDTNGGGDEKAVPLGEKNIRLVTDNELTEELLTIPIARVRRDGTGHLVYDPNFIPPCTKLTASLRLMNLLGVCWRFWRKSKKRWNVRRRKREPFKPEAGRWMLPTSGSCIRFIAVMRCCGICMFRSEGIQKNCFGRCHDWREPCAPLA